MPDQTSTLQQAETMRQSILKQEFEGEKYDKDRFFYLFKTYFAG